MQFTSYELLVWEKIGREIREIVGTSTWVALLTWAIELHYNDWPTPWFISSSRSDVEDRSIDWATFLEQLGCIPDMKGKSPRFASKALRQDDIPHLFVMVKIRVQNRNRAQSLRNLQRRSTANSNNSRSFWMPTCQCYYLVSRKQLIWFP